MPPGDGLLLVTERVVAEMLGMPTGCLRNWRLKGKGPKFYKLGKSVRYDRAEVMAWLEGCRRATTRD